jgi:hypothetical protein
MARPNIDDAVAALERVADDITEIGVSRVAEKANVPERVVRKFIRDIMSSKNSDIRKIADAVKALKVPA